MRVASTNCEIILEFDRRSPNVSEDRVRALANAMSTVEGVVLVRMKWSDTPRIVATYDADRNVAEFLREVATVLRNPTANHSMDATLPMPNGRGKGRQNPRKAMFNHEQTAPAEMVGSSRPGLIGRIFCGGMASVSFALAWVGLVVPGIPTVPFVILTVYFADKTSPFIRQIFLNSPVIGQAMRDLRAHQAVRRGFRIRALIFAGSVVMLTMMFAPPSVALYASVAVMTTLSLYLIFQIPVMDDNVDSPDAAANRSITLPIRFAVT